MRVARNTVTLSAALLAGSLCIACVNAAEPTSNTLPEDLTRASDQQLTVIASHWPQLSALQRRAVLVETKRRMDSRKAQESLAARQGKQLRSGKLSISVQRRYGRLPNGSVVIETRRVVQVRPDATPGQGQVVAETPATDSESNPGTSVHRQTARVRFGVGTRLTVTPPNTQPASQTEHPDR